MHKLEGLPPIKSMTIFNDNLFLISEERELFVAGPNRSGELGRTGPVYGLTKGEGLSRIKEVFPTGTYTYLLGENNVYYGAGSLNLGEGKVLTHGEWKALALPAGAHLIPLKESGPNASTITLLEPRRDLSLTLLHIVSRLGSL